MVIGGYIFATAILFLGGWIAINGVNGIIESVKSYRRFKYNKSQHIFTRVACSIQVLIGVAFIVFAVTMPSIFADSQRKSAEFDRLCTEAGGVIIDLDDELPECWKDKLDVSWPS